MEKAVTGSAIACNGIPHSFDSKAQMAGRKWFQKFMAHHKELSICTPFLHECINHVACK